MPGVPRGAVSADKWAVLGPWDRIILGTAQLGLAYGRRRGAGPLGEREAEEILEAAWDAGFRLFDTAEAYGDRKSVV